MKASNLGKVLGAFGLLLLLSSPITLFITSGSLVASGVKAGLGLVLLGVYFATHFKQFGQFASRRSSFFFATTVLTALVALGGLVAVNYIAHKKNQRWDLTKEKLYTLAPQTTSTLAALPDKVRAIGFVPPTHPNYGRLDDLFQRYHAAAPEKFEYTFKDPRRSPDLAAKYQLKEGQATVVLVRGEGANESHTTLNTPTEQELTNALVKLAAVGTQKVYFVTGHGEWPLEKEQAPPTDPGASLSELVRQLRQEGYTPEALNLAGKTEVPKDASVLVIAGARTPYAKPEMEVLQKYLVTGGRMLYFADAGLEDGLDSLLAEYGVQVDDGIAADAQFNSGNPYVILSLFYGEHDIVKPLKARGLNIEFPTARSLTTLRFGLVPGVKVDPVVLTSQYGWVETKPDENAVPSDGEKTGQLTLVAAATRDTKEAQDKRFDEARLVVMGDSEILLDPNWGHEPNRNLVMNSLGWASNQVQRITLRPPDRAVSTLELDEASMDGIRFVSTDLLPLTLMGMGLAIWLSRRNK
ncbi:GldG family protein [Pyxidicoccus parkwayensis]|uniref:GldG family protein n=1 Tax=Pyxidicoccus parkwayensis TaxID=2813578 RepID=A0ABX7P2Q1_9BACT|nr:Gldg family protein [Pyxidicoccus parkwaysis]QSQ24743.1 GldG family protein [Pyxidicoccus parkwaysis]